MHTAEEEQFMSAEESTSTTTTSPRAGWRWLSLLVFCCVAAAVVVFTDDRFVLHLDLQDSKVEHEDQIESTKNLDPPGAEERETPTSMDRQEDHKQEIIPQPGKTNENDSDFDLASSFSSEKNLDIKTLQVQNYRNGTALMLNFHITSSGGTTVCHWARSNGPVPSFACMAGENVPKELVAVKHKPNIPWTFNNTNLWIPQVRQLFHFVSWEWGNFEHLSRSVQETNWEHPNLISFFVFRNPMDQLLTYPKLYFHKKDGHVPTSDKWWEYANSQFTNNYALRFLLEKEGCCQGKDTSQEYVEQAKSYLERFTFLMDLDCLDESLEKLSKILGLNYDHKRANVHNSVPKTAREKIHNDTLYSYLAERNAAAIEVYEWVKDRSIVKCRPRQPAVEPLD